MKRVKKELHQKTRVTVQEYNSSHPFVNLQPIFDNVIIIDNSTPSLNSTIVADNNADNNTDHDADNDADNDAVINADNVAIGTPVNLVRVRFLSSNPDIIVDYNNGEPGVYCKVTKLSSNTAKYVKKRKRVAYFKLTENSYHSSLHQSFITEIMRSTEKDSQGKFTPLPPLPVHVIQQHMMIHYTKLKYKSKNPVGLDGSRVSTSLRS